MLHQILYIDTVFQHQAKQPRQYRSADYACLLRQEVDACGPISEPGQQSRLTL
ncbi:hypothetical protein D3C78_1646440 [compost metagenome]